MEGVRGRVGERERETERERERAIEPLSPSLLALRSPPDKL